MDAVNPVPADEGDCSSDGTATEQTRTDPCGSTWLLQSDAASRTGFSVSAIRKWRRMGLVADRKISGPGGIERVEVKLEDVLARAALHPERNPPEHAPARAEDDAAESASFQVGRVVVTIEDLESLFERMVDAERRARLAEAQVESLRGEARFMYGQLSELRRQLEVATSQEADGTTARQGTAKGSAGGGSTGVTPAVLRTEKVTAESGRRASAAAVTKGAQRAIGGHGNGSTNLLHRSATPHPLRPAAAAPDERRLEELVSRLRRVYSRLEEFRRQEVVTPDIERERQRTLAAYDRELMAVCAALRIPTGLADGEPVTVEARGALTRALARAGFDVRVAVTQAPSQKVRRIRSGLRL